MAARAAFTIMCIAKHGHAMYRDDEHPGQNKRVLDLETLHQSLFKV
jgi:hypothetical protein